MFNFIRKYSTGLLIPFAMTIIAISIFLSNRYKINNFSQDNLLSQPLNTITQTVFMYPNRTLRNLYIYTKDNVPLSANISITQGENTFSAENIAQFQIKEGSFQFPVNFKINSTNDLVILLNGKDLNSISFTDNTLLGTLSNDSTQNLKISMTFWNNINNEQKTLFYGSLILFIILYFLFVLLLREEPFFVSFSLIYLFIVSFSVSHLFLSYETLSNFAYHAYHSSLFTAIRMSDAGYFPLIPRVVTLMLIKIFHVKELYVVWTYIFSLFFFSVNTSFFTLKVFKNIVKQDSLRILIVFVLTMLIPSDIYPIYNVAYSGMGVLVLTPLLKKNQIPLWLFVAVCIIVPSLFLSKLLFLTIAPLYGILFLSYIYQAYYKKQYHWKEIAFYGIALLGALGQVVYYLFLSDYQGSHLGSINTYAVYYFLPNIARYILAPFKMNITDGNTLYMGLVLTFIILMFMRSIKNQNNLTRKIWYPFLLSFGLYVLFIAILSSIRGWNQMYRSETRHTIMPLILTYFTYLIFFFKKFNITSWWNNFIIKTISFLFIIIVMLSTLSSVRYDTNIFSYTKYSELIGNNDAYVVPLSIASMPCGSLRHKTQELAPYGQTVKPSQLTNLEQLNAFYLSGKGLTEQLTIKGYNHNGQEILSLNEYIPDYKRVAYFRFGTNTNQFTTLKIVNQNGVDRTENLNINIFTNLLQ